LLAVDNDPDASPPNRLLDVVPGGHYGFKMIHGRDGLHPFTSWQGELPGTLPMAAPIGEAASAIIPTAQTGFPQDLADTLLITSWGDHRIELHRPRPQGASLRTDMKVLVQGDEFFRPVALAPAPDGSVFVTDWVKRGYPVHQTGRIWRLRTKPGTKPGKAQTFAVTEERKQLRHLAQLGDKKGARATWTEIEPALKSSDPFLHAVAVQVLSQQRPYDMALGALKDADARVRLGALLALRAGRAPKAQVIVSRALRDPDEAVRLNALIWAAEDGMRRLVPQLGTSVEWGRGSQRLFQCYTAAVKMLTGTTGKGEAKRIATRGKIVEVIPEVKIGAPEELLRLLKRPDRAKIASWQHIEVARDLASAVHPQAVEALQGVALDPELPPHVRSEAIAGLSEQGSVEALLPLLDDKSALVRLEAARALRLAASVAKVQAGLAQALRRAQNDPSQTAFAHQLQFGLAAAGQGPLPPAVTPATVEKVLAQPGDPEAGRKVFFHPTVGCARCHTVDGRGGKVGPDLTRLNAVVIDTKRLVQSILEPSQEVAPQWVAHTVETHDGQSLFGTVIYRDREGTLTLANVGRFLLVPASQIKSRTPSTESLMPAELEKAMTVQDFRDLIAFFQRPLMN
jgi:putative heme-binding domain-containing protein